MRRPIDSSVLATSVACCATASFFVYHLVSNWALFAAACEQGADLSLILLGVDKAARFEQLTGPYSRFRFFHPGPGVFYWYALVKAVLPSSVTAAGSAMIAQAILNCFFAIAAVAVAAWHFRSAAIAVILFALSLLMFSHTGTPFLHYTWNPAVLLFPGLSLLVCAAAFLAGTSAALPVALLSATVMGHHHLGGGIFSASLLLVVAVIWFFSKDRRLPGWRWSGLSLVVLAFAALPIMADAIAASNLGNLGRIGRRLVNADDTIGFLKGVVYVAEQLVPYAKSGVTALLGSAVLIFVPYFSRRENSFELRLRQVAVAATVVAFFCATGLQEARHAYLMWFLLSLGAIWHCLAISTALSWTSARVGGSWILGAMLLSLAGWRTFPQSPLLGGFCTQAGETVTAWAKERRAPGIRIDLRSKRSWVQGAAIVRNLYAAGVPVCVQRRWGFMFGRDLICSNPPPNDWVVVTIDDRSEASSGAIFESGDTAVYAGSETLGVLPDAAPVDTEQLRLEEPFIDGSK